MRAAWYEQTGPASDVLIVGEKPAPLPQAGEVLVRIQASGVNPSDVKARAGARGPISFPYVIPHSDGAGIIEAAGEGIDSARIGERVWTWNAAWQRADGTCAEYVALPAGQAVPLPDGTDFAAGACLGIPALTAAYGVFADGEVARKTVLVTGGAGAVGQYAIQFAKWGGARVLTTVSGPAKAGIADRAGADLVINYREQDVAQAVLEATGGAGVDRVVEVEFGGNLEATRQIIKPGGTIATYGSMADPNPAIPFYELMFKNVTLRMFLVYLLEGEVRTATIERVNRALEAGALQHTIAHSYALEDIADAHEAVESGTTIGNVVVTV
ncbi:MAG: NADPH:quinone reductase [Alphaproteobacteria bacterium]|nr:MAG: NADPH:quinone reductase [Alphaproteobacteria bacterium]